MKSTEYTGTFVSDEGLTYQLACSCFGFLQAFFLLTAEAIKAGQHYQLHNIESEHGESRGIGNIRECLKLINS